MFKNILKTWGLSCSLKKCENLGEQRQLLLLHQGCCDRLEDRLELGGDQVPQHHLLRSLLLPHSLVVGKVECYCLH